MKLYHFTIPENPFLIFARGLEPHIYRADTPDSAGFMTLEQPVVWLTRQESNIVTATDITRCATHAPDHEKKIGDCIFGGPVRLTVNLNRHDRRLVHYGKWLSANGGELNAIASVLGPVALTSWYIYFGIIPPDKIETEMTVALALPGIEHQMKSHPDLEARARFAAMREQLVRLPSDYSVNLNVA